MRKREPRSSFEMCNRRFGDSFDGLEPCHSTGQIQDKQSNDGTSQVVKSWVAEVCMKAG